MDAKQIVKFSGKKAEKIEKLAVMHSSLCFTKNSSRLLKAVQTTRKKAALSWKDVTADSLIEFPVCKQMFKTVMMAFFSMLMTVWTVSILSYLLVSVSTTLNSFLNQTVYAKCLPLDYQIIVPKLP